MPTVTDHFGAITNGIFSIFPVDAVQSLKAHLPIPAKATDALIRNLRNSSINIAPNAHIEIADVMYMGDEGGICCALKVADQEEVAVVVSLTHLRLLNSNPLSPKPYEQRN